MDTTWHQTSRRRFYSSLRDRRTYAASLDLLLDFPLAVAWFCLFTTLVSVGASLLITLVGLPILTVTFVAAQHAGRFERWRAGRLLGVHIDEPVRRRSPGATLLQRLVAPFGDATTWKELAYLWIVGPVYSLLSFTALVVAWTVPLWLLTLPLYAIAWPDAGPELWNGFRIDTARETFVAAAIGLLILPLAPLTVRLLAWVDAALMRALLSPSKAQALAERVNALRETQARSVDIAIADRRRSSATCTTARSSGCCLWAWIWAWRSRSSRRIRKRRAPSSATRTKSSSARLSSSETSLAASTPPS
jgi:hypothetical protein